MSTCNHPDHDQNVYFAEVERYQGWRKFGQLGLWLSGPLLGYGIYADSTRIMAGAVWMAVVGATFFLTGLLPLHTGDILYLRKKAEQEKGIY